LANPHLASRGSAARAAAGCAAIDACPNPPPAAVAPAASAAAGVGGLLGAANVKDGTGCSVVAPVVGVLSIIVEAANMTVACNTALSHFKIVSELRQPKVNC
jgi:hypothetical protein